MSLYIHYGSANFDPAYFTEVANITTITDRDPLLTKPIGGLWASRVEASYGWRDYCEENGWYDYFHSNFCFKITPAAMVLHLYTGEDVDLLPHRNDSVYGSDSCFHPDFEQMIRDGWDAIEVHISDANEDENCELWDSLHYRLNGWDCDSILIMNPKIISPLSCF